MSEIERIVKRRKEAHAKLLAVKSPVYQAFLNMEKARTCVRCGECEEKCPYRPPISDKIAEKVAFYERVAAESSG